MIDEETNSQWDHLGRCVKGELKGKQLKQFRVISNLSGLGLFSTHILIFTNSRMNERER